MATGSHHHHTGKHAHSHSHFDFSKIPDAKLKKIATWLAIGVGVLLIGAKLTAWLIVGSVSILGSLMDSSLDILASTMNLLAVYHAMRPADSHHSFGHGKVEAISALIQALIILISTGFVYYEGAAHFLHHQDLTQPLVGIGLMAFSIVLTTILVLFQSYVVRKTHSIAITADSMHYKADLFLNIGVMISLGITLWFPVPWMDPLVGMAIASYILYTAYIITRKAFNILMDHELPEEQKIEIFEIIRAHPSTKGFHEVKTRTSGTRDFIQLHLEMDGNMTLREAHQVSAEVEKAILKRFPRLHVTIHQDPQGLKETHVSL